MKVSVSLSDDDIEYLDRYAREQRLGSRSAALQKAVRLLRTSELGHSYEQAWDEWTSSGDAEVWDQATGDGIDR